MKKSKYSRLKMNTDILEEMGNLVNELQEKIYNLDLRLKQNDENDFKIYQALKNDIKNLKIRIIKIEKVVNDKNI
jgi:hypothetical protein